MAYVTLLNVPSDFLTDWALGACYDKGCYWDDDKKKNRIKKVALQYKHESVLEFMDFVFEISASTKVLLEMTRHRMASYAVKSSRYTLNKGEVYFEPTGDPEVDKKLTEWKEVVQQMIDSGKSNDVVSLMLPQAYQYRWTAKFNARSLKNFLKLRTAKSAHYQIREVAQQMYEKIPDDLKYIFDEDVRKEQND